MRRQRATGAGTATGAAFRSGKGQVRPPAPIPRKTTPSAVPQSPSPPIPRPPHSCLLTGKRQTHRRTKKYLTRRYFLPLDCVNCHMLRHAARNTYCASFSNVDHPRRNATRATWVRLLTWSRSYVLLRQLALVLSERASRCAMALLPTLCAARHNTSIVPWVRFSVSSSSALWPRRRNLSSSSTTRLG